MRGDVLYTPPPPPQVRQGRSLCVCVCVCLLPGSPVLICSAARLRCCRATGLLPALHPSTNSFHGCACMHASMHACAWQARLALHCAFVPWPPPCPITAALVRLRGGRTEQGRSLLKLAPPLAGRESEARCDRVCLHQRCVCWHCAGALLCVIWSSLADMCSEAKRALCNKQCSSIAATSHESCFAARCTCWGCRCLRCWQVYMQQGGQHPTAAGYVARVNFGEGMTACASATCSAAQAAGARCLAAIQAPPCSVGTPGGPSDRCGWLAERRELNTTICHNLNSCASRLWRVEGVGCGEHHVPSCRPVTASVSNHVKSCHPQGKNPSHAARNSTLCEGWSEIKTPSPAACSHA